MEDKRLWVRSSTSPNPASVGLFFVENSPISCGKNTEKSCMHGEQHHGKTNCYATLLNFNGG